MKKPSKIWESLLSGFVIAAVFYVVITVSMLAFFFIFLGFEVFGKDFLQEIFLNPLIFRTSIVMGILFFLYEILIK